MFWELYFEKKDTHFAPCQRFRDSQQTYIEFHSSRGPSFGKCIGSDWIDSPDTSVHSPGVSHGECSAADSGLVSRPSFAVGMTLGHQIDGGSPQFNVFGGRKVLSFSVCESEFAQACGHGCCSTGRTLGRTVDRDCGGPAATSKAQNFRGCQSHIFPVFPSQHPTSRLTTTFNLMLGEALGSGRLRARMLRHLMAEPELLEIAKHRCFKGTLYRFEHISPAGSLERVGNAWVMNSNRDPPSDWLVDMNPHLNHVHLNRFPDEDSQPFNNFRHV